MPPSTDLDDHDVAGGGTRRIGLLLSCSSFEDFFTDGLGFSRETFLREYRNDWVWDYAKHLHGVGFDAVVLIPTYGPAQSVRTDDGIEVRFVPHVRAMRLYRRLPQLARTPPGRWLFEALGALSLWPALSGRLRADGIDLLYIQEYWTGRYDVLSVLIDIPVVAADHGGNRHRQVTLLKRWTLPRAALVTAQTSAEADAVRIFTDRVEVMPNAVDTEWFSPGEPRARSGSARLLHVARLSDHHKRTSDLLRALPLLPQDWTLDVVGTGPDEQALRTLCDELGITARVRFHGFVTDRTWLRSAYRDATALIMPSAREGRPLAALEAMACGVPVVLNDIPVLRVLVDDGVDGVLVDAPDPRALASGVRAVVDGASSMRAAARRRAEQDASWNALSLRFRRFVDAYVPPTSAA